MNHQALGVLASGRGSNLKALLDARGRGQLSLPIVLVLSDRPDAGALDIARDAGVEALYLDPGPHRTRLSDDAEARYLAELRARGITLIALAGFLRVLHRPFLEAFPDAIINIHPSLLPSFPGLSAQRQAYDHGVRVTGCTAHLVTAGIDAGPILEQAVVAVGEDDTPGTIAARILIEEHRILPLAVERVARGGWRLSGRRIVSAPTSASERSGEVR
ncbi:MAG: phosphoribosylglycinamide formyltransferase [Candidatus Eisenbacteria bacterium]|nr:phosphoribosylglycinamide formyltransferase [Candidatus Eisenbacteria bacterium]